MVINEKLISKLGIEENFLNLKKMICLSFKTKIVLFICAD